MKIAYLGHGDFGYRCLEDIISSGVIPAVCITHPMDRDAATGRVFPDVVELCAVHGIPCHVRKPSEKEDVHAILSEVKPDLVVTVSWRGILPQDILDIPPRGAINLHGSLLPKYRGNAPVTWAIINGDRESGATVHMMDAGMDTGAIIEQIRVPITPFDTVKTVLDRLLCLDGPMLVRAIGKMKDTSFVPMPQDHSKSTLAAKRRPEDGMLDWTKSAEQIYNEIRAQTHPLPGAFTILDGEKVHIWDAAMIDLSAGGPPGRILAFETGMGAALQYPVVATGNGLIIIKNADAIEKFISGVILGR